MSATQLPDSEEGHTGPIKNPKQLLFFVFFAFIATVLVIAGLVAFVNAGFKPSSAEAGGLSGVSKDALERDLAKRLERVGSVEVRDANRELASGETVFNAQCVTCHGKPGLPGAPHFGDAAAWGPRIGQGYATLLEHALKGKGAMSPQGGGDYSDLEIGRALVHMANAGGASFPVPNPPAGAAGAEGAPAAEAAK